MSTHAPFPLPSTYRKPDESKWEDLVEFHQSCTQMFGELLIYPQSVRSVNHLLSPELYERANKLLQSLDGDARSYKLSLDAILNEHLVLGRPRTGPVDNRADGRDLFTYLGIATKYKEWMENFNGLMMLPIEELTHILNSVSSINTPTGATNV